MNVKRTTSARRPSGMMFVYFLVFSGLILGIISFAVDVGRVQIAAAQAQQAADAAALYAAEGVVGGTATSVRSRAASAAADNKVNGTAVTLNTTQDVAFGIWDSSARVFLPVASGAETSATAIQVTVRCTKARGQAVPLAFASILGITSIDVTRSAIASIGKVSTASIPGMASPWLAGMPSGASILNTGTNPTAVYAPASSPIGFSVTAGETLRFASAGGTTSWDPGAGTGTAGCDGDSTYIAAQAAVNGINTTKAPLNAMMGIFLDNTAPNTTAAAATLDFSTSTSRNFSTLSPGLKQVFFIGDGLDATNTLQSFKVPSGATRLYVGTMDEKGWWWDNTGALTFTAVHGSVASLVK